MNACDECGNTIAHQIDCATGCAEDGDSDYE
jgi:hypothetical protein